jgi:hypothetical protein
MMDGVFFFLLEIWMKNTRIIRILMSTFIHGGMKCKGKGLMK